MSYSRRMTGQKCYLSPCQMEDAEAWVEWFNDPRVSIPLGDEAWTPLSVEKARAQLRETIDRQDPVFTIVELVSNRPVGRCMLFNLDWVNRSAMVGIAIGDPSCWGKGYGREALELLMEYAFDVLNLNSLMLGVFSFNERAIRLYQKVGFREIGHRREARLWAGKKYDGILMDILAEDFHRSRDGGAEPVV